MRKIEKNPTHNGKNKVPKKKDGEPANPRWRKVFLEASLEG